jgi:hypothetical protein
MPSPLNVPGQGADLPSRGSPAPAASEYYEDVDPRFAETGGIHGRTPPPIQTTNAYEDIPQGARSPAESERSHFTSISERGINPRWPGPPPGMGGPGGYGGGGSIVPRKPVVNRSDMLLNSNPDFELPPRGSPPRTAGRMIPGSAYPAGPI